MTLGMVPAVEMTEERITQWGNICESLLNDLDSGYDCYEFLNDCENADEKINTLKNLREEYALRVSNYYPDVSERTIGRIRYLFSGAMSWGDDLPESAQLFIKIEGISELYDWLEREAQFATENEKDVIDNQNHMNLNVAEQFLADPDSIDLTQILTLDDDAAETIAKYQGDLTLSSLIELSDRAATALAKHKGQLSLNSLSKFTDAVAQALSMHKGDLLYLGLTELTDVAAQAFGNHQGFLSFDSLTKLSDTAAEALSMHKGELFLDRLTKLTETTAKALSKHEGGLSLEGLTKLTDAAAKALAKHQGDLYLYGLTELNNVAAEALSRKDGHINCEDPAEWVKSLKQGM